MALNLSLLRGPLGCLFGGLCRRRGLATGLGHTDDFRLVNDSWCLIGGQCNERNRVYRGDDLQM